MKTHGRRHWRRFLVHVGSTKTIPRIETKQTLWIFTLFYANYRVDHDKSIVTNRWWYTNWFSMIHCIWKAFSAMFILFQFLESSYVDQKSPPMAAPMSFQTILISLTYNYLSKTWIKPSIPNYWILIGSQISFLSAPSL